MDTKFFEKNIVKSLKTSSHPTDELIIILRKDYNSYYSLFDDIFLKLGENYTFGENNLIVAGKTISKFKTPKASEKWIAKEMLYFIRNNLKNLK